MANDHIAGILGDKRRVEVGSGGRARGDQNASARGRLAEDRQLAVALENQALRQADHTTNSEDAVARARCFDAGAQGPGSAVIEIDDVDDLPAATTLRALAISLCAGKRIESNGTTC